MVLVNIDNRTKGRELCFNFPVSLPEPRGLGSGRSFHSPVFANEHRLAGRQTPPVERLKYLREGFPTEAGNLRCPVVTVCTDPVYIRIAWIVSLCGTLYESANAWAPDPPDVRGTGCGKDRVHVPPGRDETRRRDCVSPARPEIHLREPAQHDWPVQRFQLAGPSTDQAVVTPGSDQVCPRGRPRRSEEHTSELQSRGHLVCRLLLEQKKHVDPVRRLRTQHKQMGELNK